MKPSAVGAQAARRRARLSVLSQVRGAKDSHDLATSGGGRFPQPLLLSLKQA